MNELILTNRKKISLNECVNIDNIELLLLHQNVYVTNTSIVLFKSLADVP